MTDRERLNEIDLQLAAAHEKYNAAWLVYDEAGNAFISVAKPLWEDREHLICNLDSDDQDGQEGTV
jgi:hypothetical protein